jgi:hypothetical protein
MPVGSMTLRTRVTAKTESIVFMILLLLLNNPLIDSLARVHWPPGLQGLIALSMF